MICPKNPSEIARIFEVLMYMIIIEIKEVFRGRLLGWLRRPENICAILITILILILHLAALFQGKDYIYDEMSKVTEANYITGGKYDSPVRAIC